MNTEKIKIAFLGASGNMGERLTSYLVKEDYIDQIRILDHDHKGTRDLVRKNRKFKSKFWIIKGSIAQKDIVKQLIEGVDYVINFASAIPPESDKFPMHAIEANDIGVKTLLSVLEEVKDNQPKLIHVSTIGLYGDRCEKHMFGEVGDPLLISPFDIYSLTKMRGEYYILESDVKNWAVLRQTGVLYDKLMIKNISDGLMFHTCINTPLEWVTADMSARLFINILKRDINGELDQDNFWKHVFNLSGGKENFVTGYETMDEGFKIIGASIYDFFDPNYFAARNFHGIWFSDGDKLENLFHYHGDTLKGFWKHVLVTHKYYKLGKFVPKKLLKALIIKPLLKDSNAPHYWYKHHQEALMLASFGGSKKFEEISNNWENFNILALGKRRDGSDVDYEKLKNSPTRLNHFFDIDKPRNKIDINDLKNVAEAHGGKLITKEFKTGDIFTKVEWENSDGERFFARPHTVLCCGHWYNVSYKEYAWDFDRLAKKDKFYQQIWYDQHSPDENYYYYFDSKFEPRYKEI